MNNVLKSKESLKTIILKIIIALLPLLIYGFYKNGIKLYQNDYVNIYGLFKPLLFDIIGLTIGIIVDIIYEVIITKKMKFKESLFSSFYPLYGLLIASVISINTRLYLFISITFICLLIFKFIKKLNLNIMALTSLIIIFINKLIYGFSFLNLYEQNHSLHLNTLDYLIGRGSGGINTTCTFLLIISLLILFSIHAYKKEIPIYSSIIYIMCIIVYCIFNKQIGLILDDIFTNGILFSFIFIGTDSISSSYTNKGKIIYSIIIGLSTFGLFLIYPPLSALGGILIASICNRIIDKIILNNY